MSPHERKEQKQRTREAILAGARDLLSEGKPVTVSAAAGRRGISRATAYRYFNDADGLAAEAGLAVEVAPYEEVVAGAKTIRAKLLAINMYMIDLSLENELAFRQFLSRSLDAHISGQSPQLGRRGARRITMYQQALYSEDGRLSETAQRQLETALAATTGAEAMIALRDVAGLEPADVRVMVAEMTEAVLDRYL